MVVWTHTYTHKRARTYARTHKHTHTHIHMRRTSEEVNTNNMPIHTHADNNIAISHMFVSSNEPPPPQTSIHTDTVCILYLQHIYIYNMMYYINGRVCILPNHHYYNNNYLNGAHIRSWCGVLHVYHTLNIPVYVYYFTHASIIFFTRHNRPRVRFFSQTLMTLPRARTDVCGGDSRSSLLLCIRVTRANACVYLMRRRWDRTRTFYVASACTKPS